MRSWYVFAGILLCGLLSAAASDVRNQRAAEFRTGLEFIPNHGQILTDKGVVDTDILYATAGGGARCFLRRNSLSYVQYASVDDRTQAHRTDVSFVGANLSVLITEHDPTDGILNYYINGKRVEGVRASRKVIYHDLYPQIDLVLYANGASMKYDFIVHPGGDPKVIVMRYDGTHNLSVTPNGCLRAQTSVGTIEEQRPYTYQYGSAGLTQRNTHEVRSTREVGNTSEVNIREVACSFTRNGSDVSFRIGPYDKSHDLVIDPTVIWATYYGGSGNDVGTCVSTDKNGNVIMAGKTNSTTAIATAGAHDVTVSGWDTFIVKFNANGVRQWGTYFDGGDTIRGVSGLDVANDGTIFICGVGGIVGTSGAHQVASAGGTDFFLASFTGAGQLNWATNFGGEKSEFQSNSIGSFPMVTTSCLAVLSNGNIAFGGGTSSTTGIATPGSHKTTLSPLYNEGFLAVFNPAGALQWSTYIGGDSADMVASVAADPANDRIIIVGQTTSFENISTPGAHLENIPSVSIDGFIMSFNNDGARQWGSYYGGFYHDVLNGVTCNDQGVICAVGYAASLTGIATTGAFLETRNGLAAGMVACFNTDGTRRWGTYFGAERDNTLTVSCNATGFYVTGTVDGTTGVTTPDGMQATSGGGEDAYVVKFDVDGKRLWGSYYGGTGNDGGLSVSAADNNYYVYLSGVTKSTNAISTVGSHQTALSGTNNDAFLVKICDMPKPILKASPDSAICGGESTNIDLTSAHPTIRWFDGNNALPQLNDQLRYVTPLNLSIGTHALWVEVGNADCQVKSDTLFLKVYEPPVAAMTNDTTVCVGSKLLLDATATKGQGPYKYLWIPADGLDNSTIARPTATITGAIAYQCLVRDANGCSVFDSVLIKVHPRPRLSPTRSVALCPNDSVSIGDTATGGKAPYTYVWTPSTNLSASNLARPFARPTSTTLYRVVVTDANGCTVADSVEVVKSSMPMPVIIGSDAACPNSTVTYEVANSYTSVAWTVSGGGTITATAQKHRATASWTTAGTWLIRATVVGDDGCKVTAILQVIVADSLQSTVSPAGPITLCKDQGIVLRASKGFLSYEWSNGATDDSILVTTSGTYTVKVLGPGGCSGTSDGVVVTALTHAAPTPRIVATNTTLCSGDSVVLSLQASSIRNYLWSTGETSPTISIQTPGLYWCNVVDSAGCSGVSDSITVGVGTRPDATIQADGPLQFCAGSSVTLSAAAGTWTYLWSTGATTSSIVVTSSGTYSVRLLSPDGCSDSSSVVVVVEVSPSASIVGSDAVCFSNSTSYDIEPAQPTTHTISWSLLPAGFGSFTGATNGASVTIAWGTALGTATLEAIVANEQGCTDTARLVIRIDAELHPDVVALGPTTLCEGDSVTVSAGAGFSTYQWSDATGAISGATYQQLVVRNAGSYTCFVTNVSGCSGSSNTINVVVHPLPTRPVISATGTVLTSTPASGYQWALNNVDVPGEQSQTLTPVTVGSYSVTIIDEHGCSATSDPYVFGVGGSAVFAIGTVPNSDPATTIEVPIELLSSVGLDAANARAYIGTLRYNGTMMLPMGARGGTLTLPDRAISGTNDRTVDFAGTRAAMDAGTLMWVQFSTLLGDDTCSTLELTEVKFTDAPVSVTVVNGRFCESGVCITDGSVRLINPDVRLQLQPIHPNPVIDYGYVAYELNERGHTELLLVDMLGRVVRTYVDAIQEQGTYMVVIDVDACSTGSYHLVLRTPSAQRHQHIIISDAQ